MMCVSISGGHIKNPLLLLYILAATYVADFIHVLLVHSLEYLLFGVGSFFTSFSNFN